MTLRRRRSEGDAGAGQRPSSPTPPSKSKAGRQWTLRLCAYSRWNNAALDLGIVTVDLYGDHIARGQRMLGEARHDSLEWSIGAEVIERGRMPSEAELLQLIQH